VIAAMPASVYIHAYEDMLYVVANTADGDTHDCKDRCVDTKALVRQMSVGEL
jgi:hypothetical protein